MVARPGTNFSGDPLFVGAWGCDSECRPLDMYLTPFAHVAAAKYLAHEVLTDRSYG